MDDNDFDAIVGSLKDEMPDPDPHVNVLLVDGTVLELREVVARALAMRLGTRGYAELEDSRGSYCFVFTHGVAAIIARKEAA